MCMLTYPLTRIRANIDSGTFFFIIHFQWTANKHCIFYILNSLTLQGIFEVSIFFKFAIEVH